MTFMVTGVSVGDYDEWRPMFDADKPGAREHATGHRVFRAVDDPNEVIVRVEFPSEESAAEGRRRLVESGVLERFGVSHGPTLIDPAD
jgi:hypothetical protein